MLTMIRGEHLFQSDKQIPPLNFFEKHIPDKSIKVAGKTLGDRLSGKFYTPIHLAESLAKKVCTNLTSRGKKTVVMCDPFCGDGRLIDALLKTLSPRIDEARIYLWDTDLDALSFAKKRVRDSADILGIKVDIVAKNIDSLLGTVEYDGTVDVVVTNPPWEALKPDRKELAGMNAASKAEYVRALKEYDMKLAEGLPLSQPSTKYSGFGTNLSRCGLEKSLKLLKPGGTCGIILPSSIFSDQVSIGLRRWVFTHYSLSVLDMYSAECRLFPGVDQSIVVAVFSAEPAEVHNVTLGRFLRIEDLNSERVKLSAALLQELEYSIPPELTARELSILVRMMKLPKVQSVCGNDASSLFWMGRELDETGYKARITEGEGLLFVKGRSIDRFSSKLLYAEKLTPVGIKLPKSYDFIRLAWRDISRRSQARRMIATIIPKKLIAGNSLHVCYSKDGNLSRLKALLGVMNSLSFEFQLRARLGTGHVSLGTIRGISLPKFLDDDYLVEAMSGLTDLAISGSKEAEVEQDALVALAYGLSLSDYETLLRHFNFLTEDQVRLHLDAFMKSGKKVDSAILAASKVTIPNHYSAKLSELDLRVARSVPPGGNWKNIPKDIPSLRIKNIRKSFAAGEGSRSTYYGRLKDDKPSYTINTYFNRPGNGCHLHYDASQDRVLSEREAARLQSFPDSFVFCGSHGAVHTQIGNAVPPLLAFQIARLFPDKGQYVDLFSGCGGLSLGFKWAGWQPLVANDIEKDFLATYAKNVHGSTVCGDIRDKGIVAQILAEVSRQRDRSKPLLVIGGPPCQGFSTARGKRTLKDKRNHLFNDFKALVDSLKPDGFVFENVTGMLNMNGGEVFKLIKDKLRVGDTNFGHFVLSSEEFAVPQRRKRLFIMSLPPKWFQQMPPCPSCSLEPSPELFGKRHMAVSVADALSDLPKLLPGQDGSGLEYRTSPKTSYQLLMRGLISPDEYISTFE